MTPQAMISVAGIRGIVGETLQAEDFVRYALAFGTLLKGGKVVVGRDTRPSGEMVRNLVCGALLATGCCVEDLGIVPTPTIGIMVRARKARGGVAITASHNPVEWNALKFFRADGTLQEKADQEKLFAIHREGRFRRATLRKPARVFECSDGPAVHIARVVRNVNAAAIRRRRFRVVLDCCNGAGAAVLPALLVQLGCEVVTLFDRMDRPFERNAEPLPENLTTLCRRVRRENADMGFAVDPDADRLAIVDETGAPLGEERTVTLAAYHLLARRRSPVVVNLSTTRAMDDVARLRSVEVIRTPVGEAHVVAGMRRHRAQIGGEGNGGVIWPKVAMGRDAAAGIGLILEALATRGEPVSRFNRRIPDYVMRKMKVPLERDRVQSVFARLEEAMGRAAQVWKTDGLRMDFPDGWFHLRPSGTEPIVRLFVEARTCEDAEKLTAEILQLL
ncbi:MAG: phosphoglucosamine mutase [Candidatus Sumerlaeia bacterium]|nr:phosphoglucosamine mutase [Candidatus Sumerlaeia bacterium]